MGRWIGPVGFIAAAMAALLLPMRAGLAWGPEGHRVIALIADRALQQSDPDVRAKILAVLATDKGKGLTKNDIASEATWADVLREKSEEARHATGAWHSTRFQPDNPDLARACFSRPPLPAGYPASHGPKDNCSIDKITQFAAELKNPETSPGERLAAEIGSKPPVRLSSYWQEVLVAEVVGSDPAKGAARIAASVPAAEAQKWAEGTPEAWALETYQTAKTITYSFAAGQPEGKHNFPARAGQTDSCPSAALYRVSPEYETKALAAVRLQIAKAGLRLARVLRDSVK